MESFTAVSISPGPSLRRLQSFALPCFSDLTTGPLHTVIEDSIGNVYYSDEINHRVVSLKADGSVRWYKIRKGTAAGEFCYPRGLSLGRIQLHDRTIPCLAVADGWNQRVQFLDIEGNQIAIWTHGGDFEFGEISDVRFMPEYTEFNSCKGSAGFWYVLDRGNSCLFKLGINGTLLDRIGRCFPSNMRNRWAAPDVFFCGSDSAFNATEIFTPLNFAFYPERILGNSIDSLFITEAGSQMLKQVLPPHLIPLRLNIPKTLEWIAADSSGLLAWDRSARRLTRLAGTHIGCDFAGICNGPIPSNLPIEYFWLQTGENIEKWKWDLRTDQASGDHPKRYPWIEMSATEEIRNLDLAKIRKSVETSLALLDDEIKLGDSILAMSYEGIPAEYLDEMSKHAIEFSTKCTWFNKAMREALHHWCLGRLQGSIAKMQPDPTDEQMAIFEEAKRGLIDQIALRVREIQKRLDALNFRLSSISTNMDTSSCSPKTWIYVAEISKSNLEHAKGWIASWSGMNYSTHH